MPRFILTLLTALLVPMVAAAQSPTQLERLYQALGMHEVLEIMREEGLGYGVQMQQDVLGGQGGARWPEAVSSIYDVDRMAEIVKRRLTGALTGDEMDAASDFFEGALGARIIGLEVSAREAFLEEEVEELSVEAFAQLEEDADPRADLIRDLTKEADLIENNVVGAMNSNYAFYVGLAEGGGLSAELSQDEILADVWAQEPDIRSDTTEWLYSYLNLAYQPLSDEELKLYTAFYVSETGAALNSAIFGAFDEVFSSISYALGQSAAGFMAGEEL